MIRALRARHRRMILVVALLAGSLMVAGLSARHAAPKVQPELRTLVGE